ncbi:NUDIX domain-containing protein [Patescibacteria group bacterium]|nr:NUDIX domain-containing protein [Patescibacteria group bacterium]MBU1473105.1 NUDIX domain-containing protein [Patescibacteria group bacterium]MBU2459641.1 NUDIX domain-containing protein [Patescibacteria group bacterium]MBU2544456.1 NUDIX domain-containing protein [Patescibacteria group bacterium]
MDDELVDIVDWNNVIIGKTTKQEAHEKGLLHRTVIAEVINPHGKWALVRQASDRQDAGQFVSPVGGHIRSGESEIEALRRETEEETGITEFTSKYIGKAIYNRRVLGRCENHFFILFEIYTNQKPRLNHESVEYRWFSPQEIRTTIANNPDIIGDALHFVARTFYPNLLIK